MKIENETKNRRLISLAREIRSLVHDARYQNVKEVLDEFEEAIPDDEDAYYFKAILGDLRYSLKRINL